MGNSAISKVNLGVPAFIQSFTNGDLAAGVLTVTHNFNAQYLSVTVYNNSGIIIIPDDVTATSPTQTTIDLLSYGTLTGTWRAVILNSGATMNSVASDLSLAGQTTDDIAVFNGTNWVAQPPSAPSFIGFNASANGTQLNIPTGVSQVQFANENFDIGGNFASNVFTAPVTGYYQFNAAVVLRNIDSAAANYQIHMRGTSFNSVVATFDSDSILSADIVNDLSFHVSEVMFMTAGNTMDVVVTQGASGSAQTDIDGARFSGFYVGS